MIDIAITDYEIGDNGWTFDTRTPEATGDPVYNSKYLKEIYFKVYTSLLLIHLLIRLV